MQFHRFLLRFTWPIIVIGAMLAIACLASIGYINRLQANMTQAIRHDSAARESAQELQIQLRQLRFHSLMSAADPSPVRRKYVDDDRAAVVAALVVARRECDADSDIQLLEAIEESYLKYMNDLENDLLIGSSQGTNAGLIKWSDAHRIQGLLATCRELVDRKRDQMSASLQRSENQTNWAGNILLYLGIFGAIGGLLSGFATARRLDRKETRLYVRVQAVQAHLDQEVGSVTLEAPDSTRDLDEQLDCVVDKVKKVCEKLQEQERDLLRADQLVAVGHLAAGVAHEIRNPLTGIKFLIEAALSPNKSTCLSVEDLRLVGKEIIRMERTIQELLDFARKPQLDRQSHDLKSLVMEATEITRGRAAAKPVSILVDAPACSIPAVIDHDQILSLLTNLLLNSIDATPPGGEIRLELYSAQNGFFKIEVVDNGPGIDPAVATRLFTPFATTKSTGTGLGLTIAHRIACDHGGTLAAYNRSQGGACFTLTLPITEKANGEAPCRR